MSNKIYRCLPSIDKVGIEFNKDIINVYFPLGYDIPHLIDEKAQLIEEKKAILDVIKTVSLCKNNGEVYRYNYKREMTWMFFRPILRKERNGRY